MLVGARTGAWSGGKRDYTARDYVQDGLVLMLDAIENIGWGQSNPSLTNNWVDLVGGLKFTYYQAPFDFSSGLYTNNLGGITSRTIGRTLGYNYTMEVFHFGKVGYTGDNTSGCAHYIDFNESRYGNISTFGVKERNSNIPTTLPAAVAAKIPFNSISMSSNDESGRHVIDGVVYGNVRRGEGVSTSKFTPFRIYNSRGRVCCYRVYDRQLTVEEVMKNYAIDKVRFGIK